MPGGKRGFGKEQRQHARKGDARAGHANQDLVGRRVGSVHQDGGGGALLGLEEKGLVFGEGQVAWPGGGRRGEASQRVASPTTSPSSSLAISAAVNMCIYIVFLQVAGLLEKHG